MNWLILALLFLLLFYVMFMLFMRWLKRSFVSSEDKKYFLLHWKRISLEKDGRTKVLELDKLLEHMLKRRGFTGSLGEILKKSSVIFSDLDNLWTAHKLRNKIAHEVGFVTNEKQTVQAVKAFLRAFDDLGLTDK